MRTVYLAGELFSAKHLIGNALLAQAIFDESGGRLACVLPQNLEQRETTAHAVRDQDLRAVLSCDLGLFHFDGTDLDSGTVVEYMFAKFADIPTVILRTDFRHSGDQSKAGDPWNLMNSYFPRTKNIVLDGMGLYQKFLPANRSSMDAAAQLAARVSEKASEGLNRHLAKICVQALDEVAALPPVLEGPLAGPVYDWLSVLPAFAPGTGLTREELRQLLAAKRAKGLLS